MIDIKNERLKQSMSQKRLAYAAGIDARTLRKLENGEPVSVETFRAVCGALGIKPEVSVEGASNQRPLAVDGKTGERKVGFWKGMNPQLSIGILAIVFMIGLPWAALSLAHAFTVTDFDANLRMEVALLGPCGEQTIRLTEEAMKRAFPESVVFDTDVVTGTKTCTVPFKMMVDSQSEDEVIKALQRFDIDARILAFRPQ